MLPGNPVQLAEEAQSFVTRRIASETLLVPVARHVMNLESIYVVNDVAARIWELLARPTDVERIASALTDEFDVSLDQARADAAAFVSLLLERGLVRATAPPA
ncbi:MAG TPA: PqqD family protein [Vicinamibacterales bacterium]|jgi:hypothetical protein